VTAAVIALSVVAAVALVVPAAILLRPRLNPGPSLASKTIVVHTTDGKSLRGVLHGQYADRITLREAVILHGEDEQPAGGLQHIPLGSISWMQELLPEDR
jgi:hypothetical protein